MARRHRAIRGVAVERAGVRGVEFVVHVVLVAKRVPVVEDVKVRPERLSVGDAAVVDAVVPPHVDADDAVGARLER